MTALDRVEFERESPSEALSIVESDGSPAHPGVARFAEHAVRAYLAAVPLQDAVQLRPVRELWIAQRVLPSVVWELYAWGRRYESVDGGLREFRFLRLGAARQRSVTEVAIAAYVAASALRGSGPATSTPPIRSCARPTSHRRRREYPQGFTTERAR